jgi:tetratricopeptide (TPR) repeat protein
LKLYSREFTYFLAILPLLGLYPLWKRHKAGFLLVVGLLIYATGGFLFVLNFNLDKESIWVNNVFFIPTYIMAAILMGTAIAALADVNVRKWRLRVPAACLAVCLPVLPLSFNYYWNDKSDYWFAHDYGVNIFKSLDENAVYFPVADHATFPLIYLQAVEGMRPDVVIANKYGYPEELFYDKMPYDLRVMYGHIPTETESQRIEDWVVARGDRPVYFTRKRPLSVPGTEMRNCGIVYKAAKSEEPAKERNFWDDYEWHTLDPGMHRGEYTAEAVLSDYYFFHARYQLENGNRDEGLSDLATSLAVAGSSKESFNNIASACAEYGQLKEAADYFRQALAVDPEYSLGLVNGAKVQMQLGEFREALPLIERAIKVEPDNIEMYWLLSHCRQQLALYQEAIETLEKISEMTPKDPRVFRELGMLYLNHMRQRDMAKRYFSQSLRLDPNQPDLLNLLVEGGSAPVNADVSEMQPMQGLPQVPVPPVPQAPNLPPTVRDVGPAGIAGLGRTAD